jgi:CubicO group peptidase (beta-lactamase class C family)
VKGIVEDLVERFGVPGAAVAVVAGGRLLVHEGFGHADVETAQPVTTATSFAIASVTKSMTAAAVATLVERGLVDWDEPVRTFVPGFEMHDHVATERLSVRDLLCHRSGLPRHDLVHHHRAGISRADLVRALRHLPPSRDLRTTWQYNNLMYVAAGHLCELVTGGSWEEHLTASILGPLGMTASSFSWQGAEKLGPVARPYSLLDGELRRIPYAAGAFLSGPCGSVYSTLDDMLRWLRVHLDGGVLDGAQVMSAHIVDQLMSQQSITGGAPVFPEIRPVGYGLGWMIELFRGRRVIHHGGNIDGFTAFVAMMPDEAIGVVVLTNRTDSFLRHAVAYSVFDAITGEEDPGWGDRYLGREDAYFGGQSALGASIARRPASPPTHPLADYAGRYLHPAYGHIDVAAGAELAFTWHIGDLTAEHRHFDTWDVTLVGESAAPMAFTFRTGADGYVEQLDVPAEAMVGPITFDRVPDPALRDVEVLARWAGRWEMGAMHVDLVVEGNHLVVSGPGVPRLQLEPVRARVFRSPAMPALTLEADDRGGAVTEIRLAPYGVFTRA